MIADATEASSGVVITTWFWLLSAVRMASSAIEIESSQPGCVAADEVRSAVEERLGAPRISEGDQVGWKVLYRVVPWQGHAFRLELEIRAQSRAALERTLDLSESDCGAAPSTIAAVVERYFRELGWTSGAPLPKPASSYASAPPPTAPADRRHPARSTTPVPAASSVPAASVARTPTPATTSTSTSSATPAPTPAAVPTPAAAPPPAAVATPTAAPPPAQAATSTPVALAADLSRSAPLLSIQVGAGVTSYPSPNPSASIGVRLRLHPRWYTELVAWSPGYAHKDFSEGGGRANLESWTGQLWFSFLVLRAPRWFLGPVGGLGYDQGSTESPVDYPDKKRRAILDGGLGTEVAIDLYGSLSVGLTVWGGGTLLGNRFYVDRQNPNLLDESPWKTGWETGLKGAVGIRIGYSVLH